MSKPTIWGKHPKLPLYVSIDGEVCSAKSRHYYPEWHKYSFHETHKGINGYYRFTISIDGNKSQHTVHRLVIETFKQYPIPSHLQVDHINNVKKDNRFENLQLLTPSENTLKSARIGSLNGRATIDLNTAQAIWDEGEKYWNDKYKYYNKPYASVIAKKFKTTSKIVIKILSRATWAEIDRTNNKGR